MPTTVIVLGCENIEQTEECLWSVVQYSPWVNILYVDNGSSVQDFSRLRRSLRAISEKIIITRLPENRGFTQGNNHGIAYARSLFGGTDVVLLNNDCFVGPGCIESLRNLSQENLAIVGPVTVDGGAESLRNSNVRQLCQFSLPVSAGELEKILGEYSRSHCSLLAEAVSRHVTSPVRQGYIPFCCAYIPSQALERVGQLATDQSYSSGLHADTEWCRRAGDAGFVSMLDTNAFAWHLGSSTFKSLGADYQSELLRSREKFEKDGSDHVVAAMLLCDRKRYCGAESLQAVSRLYGLRKIYVNIETKFPESELHRDAKYSQVLEFARTSPIPVDIDIWTMQSTWMKPRPSHDQDQYYRLPRIVAGRNQACEWFWSQSEATHLLFIDSDVIPRPDGLQRLLAHKKPLTGGLVHGRGEHSHVRVLFDVLSQQDNLLECRWGSCGYMLIERQVLDVQRFRWGISRAEPGQLRSEDPAFCEDAFLNGFGRYWIDEAVVADHIDDPQSPLVITDVAEF